MGQLYRIKAALVKSPLQLKFTQYCAKVLSHPSFPYILPLRSQTFLEHFKAVLSKALRSFSDFLWTLAPFPTHFQSCPCPQYLTIFRGMFFLFVEPLSPDTLLIHK